ncbi:MAG: Uma2 family endonuclease [Planctomycetota bacterium]
MTALPEQRVRLTVDELERYAAEHGRCELIDGEVFHMSPAGTNHGDITGALHAYLGYFALENKLGRVYTAETGFRVSGEQTVRAPDIAFIRSDRVPAIRHGYAEVMPDLVVETVSPNDKLSDVNAKIDWWLAQGVRLAWVVDPSTQQVTAHDGSDTVRVFRGDKPLDGGDVVPGFTLPLGKVFN